MKLIVSLCHMGNLADEIKTFLQNNDLQYVTLSENGIDAIQTTGPGKSKGKIILPLEINAETASEATVKSTEIAAQIQRIINQTGDYPLIIPEDRWRSNKRMTENRLLAHLGVFCQVYARNCEVRRIDKNTAQEFLSETHSYGYAACRYRYGIFLKRHTGHNTHDCEGIDVLSPGRLVAVATFSNARKWLKAGKEIRSYEWTRYASLPQVRINGGMGKVLKAFSEDVNPDDIMSYADLEWSTGSAYDSLGFTLEGYKDPVIFCINTTDWSRKPVSTGEEAGLFLQNFGSNKYRLKLTDYQ